MSALTRLLRGDTIAAARNVDAGTPQTVPTCRQHIGERAWNFVSPEGWRFGFARAWCDGCNGIVRTDWAGRIPPHRPARPDKDAPGVWRVSPCGCLRTHVHPAHRAAIEQAGGIYNPALPCPHCDGIAARTEQDPFEPDYDWPEA